MSIAGFSSLDIGTPQAAQSPSVPTESDAGELKNEFLTLMVAQIQNQNPLEPLDGAEYVSQLAQFSQVESSENLTKLMQNNTAILGNMQTLSVVGLVDKTVWSETSTLTTDGSEVPAQVLTTGGHHPLEVIVTDQNGTQKTINLGAQNAGRHEFSIDSEELGLAEGPLHLQVNGDESARFSVSGRVESVVVPSDGSAPILTIAGIGQVPFYQIAKFGA